MSTSSNINKAIWSDFSNTEKWAIACLIALSFTGISIINIGKAMLTPFHLIMGFQILYALCVSRLQTKTISISLIAFLSYVVCLNTFQFAHIRVTSVVYTLIYGVEITILINLLSRCSIQAITTALKWIVYAYFVNILVGFCFDLLHFKQDLLLQFIRTYYAKGETYGRPMGFSSEPSYAAFILAVVTLAHAHLTQHKGKDNLYLIIFVFMAIVLTKSAYGFLFLSIVAMDWAIFLYRKGDRLLKLVYPAIIALFIGFSFLLVNNSEQETLQRLNKFTSCLFDNSVTGQKKLVKLQEADASAFARIAPSYLLFSNNQQTDFNFLIGQGAGAAGKYLSTFLVGILVDEGRTSVDTGIMPALIFDYGYLGSAIFLIFLCCTFQKLPSTFWILFLLIIPNANINTQLIWFAIACFAIVGKLK